MKTPQTSWNREATWYDRLLEEGSGAYQSGVILPNLMRLIDPHRGETILDVACGQGFFSRACAERGARVIGTDIAKDLIELARKKPDKNIEYFVSPADRIAPIKHHSIDTAICVLALQNIENLDGVVSEAKRVLVPNGRLAIVLNHPAFRIPAHSAWGWDDRTKTQYRRVDEYLSESRAKIDMHPSLARRSGAKAAENDPLRSFTVSFHRPLQVYMKALAKNGFAVTRLEEWISNKTSEPGPRAKEENRIRKEIPLFLFLEARST